jgi:hypothetical protein
MRLWYLAHTRESTAVRRVRCTRRSTFASADALTIIETDWL